MEGGREDQVSWPSFPFCSSCMLSCTVSQSPTIYSPSVSGCCWKKSKEELFTVFSFKKFTAGKMCINVVVLALFTQYFSSLTKHRVGYTFLLHYT